MANGDGLTIVVHRVKPYFLDIATTQNWLLQEPLTPRKAYACTAPQF